MRQKWIILLIITTLLLTGCTNTQEITQLNNRIDALETVNQRLEEDNSKLNDRLQQYQSQEDNQEAIDDESQTLLDLESECARLESETEKLTTDVTNLEYKLGLYRQLDDDQFWSNDRVTDRSFMIGTWQDDYMISAAYGERYHFYSNGEFLYEASQYDTEGRIVSYFGTWNVIKNFLYLTINSKVVREGGVYETDEMAYTGFSLNDYEEIRIQLDEPEALIYPLSDYIPQEEQPYNDPSSMKFGGIEYWHIHTDPSAYLNGE